MIKPLQIDLSVIALVLERPGKAAVGTCERKKDKSRHEEEGSLSAIHHRTMRRAPWQRWHLIPRAPDRAKAIKEPELTVAGLYRTRAEAS